MMPKRKLKAESERKRELEKRIASIKTERERLKKDMLSYSHEILYWQTLLIMLLANFIASIILVPVLMAIKGWFIYVIVMTMGIIFGIIFNHLITDIENIKRRHHIFAGTFLPAVAVIDFFIMVKLANKFAETLRIDVMQDSFIISVTFIGAFLLPYIVGALKKK